MAQNLIANGQAQQGTSAAMLVTGADITTPEGVQQSTPTSAQIITTPPTFAGITAAIPNTDGSIRTTWSPATTINPPVEYLVFIAPGVVTPAALFAGVPSAISVGLSAVLTTLSDGLTYLVNEQVYTLGVRARDGVGNLNTNLVTIQTTATGSGNLPEILQDVALSLETTNEDIRAELAAIDPNIITGIIEDETLTGTTEDAEIVGGVEP